MRAFGRRSMGSPRDSFFVDTPEEDAIGGISAEDVHDLKLAFYTAAKSGDGSIDGEELKTMLESLGYVPTMRQTDAIIMQMARRPGSKVSFDEFLVFVHWAGVETAFQAEIREVLEVFNKYARKEEAGRRELSKIVRHLCADLSEADVNSLVARMVTQHNGRVSFRQFISSMYK